MAVKTKNDTDNADYRDYDPKKKESTSTGRKKFQDLINRFDKSYLRR